MTKSETTKKTLFQLLKQAWNEWRSESREAKRMKEYSEVIHLHSKQVCSFPIHETESSVMQAYFKACRDKEAEVAKNVRAMVFGASPEEKAKLKENLMGLGIDLDSIISEADAEDNITNEVMYFTGIKETAEDYYPNTMERPDNDWAYSVGKPVADMVFKPEELAENERVSPDSISVSTNTIRVDQIPKGTRYSKTADEVEADKFHNYVPGPSSSSGEQK